MVWLATRSVECSFTPRLHEHAVYTAIWPQTCATLPQTCACHRNKDAILEVLKEHLTSRQGTVLEVASGVTGTVLLLGDQSWTFEPGLGAIHGRQHCLSGCVSAELHTLMPLPQLLRAGTSAVQPSSQ